MEKLTKVAVLGESVLLKELRRPMDEVAEELGLELAFRPARQAAESTEPVIICLSAIGERLAAEAAEKLSQPVLNVPVAGEGDEPLAVLQDQMAGAGQAGTLALGLAGARNAVLAAASIIALNNLEVRKALDNFRIRQTNTVLATEMRGG